MRKLQLVEVEWEDTTSSGRWVNEKDALVMPAQIHTVGWKLKATRKYLLLITQRDETYDECADRIRIPRGCIRSIRRIE